MILNCLVLFGWIVLWWPVRCAWTWSAVVLRVVAWWAVVCGGFAVWPVWSVMAGPVTVSSVCWRGLSWAASMVAGSVPLMWSGAASVQVMTAGAAVSAVSRTWSGLVSSFLVFPVVSRAWSSVAVSVCLVVQHQCSQRGYPDGGSPWWYVYIHHINDIW